MIESMKLMSCECCGANDWIEDGKFRVCKYCGSKFQIVKEKSITYRSNGNGQRGIEYFTESEIALDDDIQRLLNKCKEEPWNAKKYANLILDIDSGNVEALKYLRRK